MQNINIQPQNSISACVIGASGLIGSNILLELLKNPAIQKVKILVRKPLDIQNKKLEQICIDFNDLERFKNAMSQSQVVFCAVGTTQKKTKNLEEYRAIDVDIPVHAAMFSEQAGCAHFLLVSSVGANIQSSNFYLRLKGEVEQSLQALKIPRISIFRPSMLLGERKEFRFGERIGQILMPFFSFLIPSKYKPILAKQVALAMVQVALDHNKTSKIYHYQDMMRLTS